MPLEGHSYTYEGSVWGKIVQILMDCKCMNPVIYFDEIFNACMGQIDGNVDMDRSPQL